MQQSIATTHEVKPLEERRRLLDAEAAAFAGPDGKVALESPTTSIVTKGEPVGGPIHVILTIFTVGIWGIVWLVLAKTRGEKRWRLTVDEYGEVTTERT